MNQKLLVLLFLTAVAGIGFWNFRQPPEISAPTDQVRVVTSFYPLAYLAGQIGGDHVLVANLTPPGSEPHDFEPSTRDIAAIETSQALFINGEGFEPWAQGLIENLQNKNVRVVSVADGLTSLEADPHVWLDPLLYKEEVARIAETLIAADPENRVEYEANSAHLIARLEELDKEFQAELSSCQQKNIVTSHSAFGYLAQRYGLKQVAIAGLSPEEEPSPKDLATIAQFAHQNDVRFIFFETLVSPRLAETVANEIGAQTLVLNPIEGLSEEEQAAGQDYFSLQRENLANLKIALDCK